MHMREKSHLCALARLEHLFLFDQFVMIFESISLLRLSRLRSGFVYFDSFSDVILYACRALDVVSGYGPDQSWSCEEDEGRQRAPCADNFSTSDAYDLICDSL